MSFECNTINSERIAGILKSACDDLSTMMHTVKENTSRSVEDLALMASLAAEIDEIISCYDTSCLIDNAYLCECGSLVIEYKMRFTENKPLFDERKLNGERE